MLRQIGKEHLERALHSNKVVLFLGAGFSCEAINKNQLKFPSSKELSKILWEYTYKDDEYEETDLQIIFEAALKSQKGIRSLHEILKNVMGCSSVPDWYRNITSQYWYRIYTTNIDDLVEVIFKKPKLRFNLEQIVAPRDDFSERDQFLNKLQYIKLNGSIEYDPRTYTFSARQFAKRSTEYDIWYDHFVRDYMTHVTVFIGTELNEPLFWRHIELRERRERKETEQRPKSYLICPKISRPKQSILNDYNIIPIEAKSEEFFIWLKENIKSPESKQSVIQASNPKLIEIFQFEEEGVKRADINRLETFFKNFQLVNIEQPSAGHRRKSYLLGKEPQWQDLYHNLDAKREINDLFINEVAEVAKGNQDNINVIALTGTAGSGKSTILMRTALYFCAQGFQCYYTQSEELIKWEDFISAIKVIDKDLIIFIDNADHSLGWLAGLIENFGDIDRKLTFILASRTNKYEKFAGNLLQVSKVKEIDTPNLSDTDIEKIIQKLSDEDLLGKLRGKNNQQRFSEFKDRARKQILIAMREATQGKDFDEILKGEYNEIEPYEARKIYLCIALASAEHFKLSRQQIVATAIDRYSAILTYLDRNLKGPISQPYEGSNIYECRHPVIAEFIINDIAERSHLKDAYICILSVLAHDMGNNPDFGNRIYRLYRRLINHLSIFHHFQKNIKHARDIYESVRNYIGDDFHFWLQYGSLELSFGELDYAANYLAQAESLRPYDKFILTAIGHLYYRQSLVADSLHSASRLRQDGKDYILDQINSRPDFSAHPFHIFGSQEMRYAQKWYAKDDFDECKNILQNASEVVKSGLRLHRRNPELIQLEDDIKRALLSLAIP